MSKTLNKSLLISVLMGCFFLFGCGEKKDEVFKIGVIYPLTGEASFWGNNARNGAELAVERINANGGIAGKKVIALYEDSKSSPKDAVTATNKLIAQDGVKFIVGDLASSNLLAMAPICEQYGIVTIGQGSNPKIREAGEYIFRTWPSDDFQGRAVAEFLNNNLVPRQISILFVNNEYGTGVVEIVKRHCKSSIVLSEAYDPSQRDFRTLIQKIPKTSDALVLVAYPEELPALLKQLGEARFSKPVVGTETFENENVKKMSLEYPIFYTMPQFADSTSIIFQDFLKAYKERFGKESGVPADPAFDAMMLVLKGIEKEGYDPAKVKDYLLTVRNYEGASGRITFDDHGDVIKPFRVKKLQSGKDLTAGEVHF